MPTKHPGDIFVLVLGIRHIGSSSPIYAIFKSVNYTMLLAAQLLPQGAGPARVSLPLWRAF